MLHNQTRVLGTALGIIMVFLLFADLAAADTSQFGNRLWDGTKGMSNQTYKWNAYSFAGFYYDIDANLTTEELTIKNIKITIAEGDISYNTSPIEVSFDYSPFGKYQVIGFMAGKYFAGYTKNSSISGNKEISTIGSGQLHRVLLDDENRRVISEGGTFTLKEGYVLRLKEIDIGAGPRQIWLTLLKDGVEVDSDVAAAGDTYVYSKKAGALSDLPVIAVRFDSVFRGREVNAAFIKGVFQISDSYTQVRSGDRYGAMKITGASRDRITMNNRNVIDLSPGNTIDLMGDLKIIVANNDTLRFALSVERTGTYEARGTIYPVAKVWTPLNFGLNIGGTSVGFYYDMDEDIGTENLNIIERSGTSIPERKLIYSTSPQEVSFDYSAFGKYQVTGFMADKYFAGYTANSSISGNRRISTIGSGQLHKVLLDDDDRRAVAEGGTLTLKEGYVLKLTAVDIGAAPGQVWITLLKDGSEVDSDVVAAGETYVYSKKVGVVSDLPTIAVHFVSVFRGREVNAAFTRGIFQISEALTSVKGGDRYGQMAISSVGAGGITMDNPSSISLSPGSTADLMGNIKFKVADSSDVRFYPFVMVTPEMVVNQLVIDAPARATAGDTVKIKVTAAGIAVEGASITIEPEIGQIDDRTGRDGVLDYTLPRALKGVYNITATKLGYQKATRSIEVQEYIEKRLSIDAPSKANQFETITIRVAHNDTPISGATVSYNNESIGTTGIDGALNYTLEISGTHTISASKNGYITASREIDVIVPFPEFRAMDINITPDVVLKDQETVIRSNITNAGTKADTLPVVLIINSTEVGTMSVTLAPHEVKEINFTYKADLLAGNYTVKILGQKVSLEVKEPPLNIFLIAGIVIVVTVIGAIIIYFLTKIYRKF
ncbi:S-layer protein [groundwater metagenome]